MRRSPRSAFALTGHLGAQLSCGLGEHRLVAVTEALADVLGDRGGVGVEHRAGPPAPHHLAVKTVNVERLGDLGKRGAELFFERSSVLPVEGRPDSWPGRSAKSFWLVMRCFGGWDDPVGKSTTRPSSSPC